MPETYRDQKRQQAWAKAEAKRVIAQEQADALTDLGVPCAQRSGWVVVLDPVGLRIKLDPSGAVTGWPAASAALAAKLPQTPTADATRAAETRPDLPEGDWAQMDERVSDRHTEPEGER